MKLPIDDQAEVIAPTTERKRRRRNERNAAMYDQDVFDLLQAMDAWRRKNNRSFPAWSEVIGIMEGLGWRRAARAVAPAPSLEPVDPIAPTTTDGG